MSLKKFPDIHLGIGTIRTIEHIDIAAEADASFLITPGFSESLANHAALKKYTNDSWRSDSFRNYQSQ